MKKKEKKKILGADVQLELRLPEPWLSRDKWEKSHWGAKGRLIDKVAAQYVRQISAIALDLPLINVTITAMRINWRELDDDNLKAGLKPYIDAMTQRHPKGMGLILDDRPSIITGGINASQHKCKKADMADQAGSFFIIHGSQTLDATGQ